MPIADTNKFSPKIHNKHERKRGIHGPADINMIEIKEEKTDIFSQTHTGNKLSNFIDSEVVSEDVASILKVNLSRFDGENSPLKTLPSSARHVLTRNQKSLTKSTHLRTAKNSEERIVNIISLRNSFARDASNKPKPNEIKEKKKRFTIKIKTGSTKLNQVQRD